MKRFILAFALLIGVASFHNTTQAQSINININIGSQPAWGPTGYDYVGFYYFPEINCYYDVNLGMFHYIHNGYWVSARYLPYAYRNYDMYRLYKVVLNVREPWRYNHAHYRDYKRYKGYNHRQVVIRDSRDYRYNDSRRNTRAWYSSDKNSHKRHDYNYNDNRNNNNSRPNYNGNNNKTTRPSYNSNNNNSRNDNKRYQSNNSSRENSRDKYNDKKDNNKNNNRQNMSSRDNNRQNNRQEVQRQNSRENNKDNNKRSSKSSDFRLASNNGRGR